MSPVRRAACLVLAGALAAVAAGGVARAQHDGHPPQHQHPWVAPAAERTHRNPVTASPESVQAGRALYARHCASCHGPTGKGDGAAMPALSHPPPDLAEPPVQRQTDGALFRKITTGNPLIPAWGTLSATERWISSTSFAGSRHPAG